MSGEASAITAAVSSATVPSSVRKEGSEAVDGYRAALEFEGMLLKQMLTEALPESASGEEEGEEDGALTAGTQLANLPETVTAAVLGAGGLGLAGQMYTNFEGVG